jgi:hypothetical protein
MSTKAVIDTRALLRMLASGDEIIINRLAQTVTLDLFRHYPLNVDLDVPAAAMPKSKPCRKHRHAGSTAPPKCQTRIPNERDADDIREPGVDDDQTAYGS